MRSVVVIDGEATIDILQDGDSNLDMLQDGEGNDILVSETGTFLHDELLHREYPNQHPLEAIAGLLEALARKPNIEDLSIINCGTSTEVLPIDSGVIVIDEIDEGGGTVTNITATVISGMANITENGTYDISNYAAVNVNVPNQNH